MEINVENVNFYSKYSLYKKIKLSQINDLLYLLITYLLRKKLRESDFFSKF